MSRARSEKVRRPRPRAPSPGAQLATAPTPPSIGTSGPERAAELEHELQRARAALQGSVEELQNSNEELRSMLEELRSTNEELQSSNEQLLISKEELNSLNAELQAKMRELSTTNDDMANLLESTDIATLFLDRQLRIKRFTELAREVINLLPRDIGRPLGDLVSHLRYDRLAEDARNVLGSLQAHEFEVQTTEGYWRLVRIHPYRTSHGAIAGVIINFLDIDRVKRAELLAASRALADSVVHTVQEPLAVLDPALNIVSANPAFLALFDLGAGTPMQGSLFEVGGGVFARSKLRARLQRLLVEGAPLQDVLLDHPSGEGSPRRLFVNARRLLGPLAAPGHLLLALGDQSRD